MSAVTGDVLFTEEVLAVEMWAYIYSAESDFFPTQKEHFVASQHPVVRIVYIALTDELNRGDPERIQSWTVSTSVRFSSGGADV